ncbi:MAG TPA: heavy metal-responsive transcriptional regulator [Gemmatimonadaceae bacterium]
MKIGEVAAMAGVPTATVRYYERRRLIAPSQRSASGYRQYDSAAAERLRFIKHAQGLGFSLDEIQEMLELPAGDPAACARVEAVARDKIREVRQRLAELQRLERVLQTVVASCADHRAADLCPVLVALANGAAAPRRPGAGRNPRAAAGRG